MTHEPSPKSIRLSTVVWVATALAAIIGLPTAWYTLKSKMVEDALRKPVMSSEQMKVFEDKFESKEVASVRYAMLLDRLKSIEEKQDQIIRRLTRERADVRPIP